MRSADFSNRFKSQRRWHKDKVVFAFVKIYEGKFLEKNLTRLKKGFYCEICKKQALLLLFAFHAANARISEKMLSFLKKKIEKNWLIAIALAVGFSACGPDREAVVSEKVAERINTFKTKRQGECTAALLRAAEKIVDSLLLEEAEAQLKDSLIRLIPNKPPRPAPLSPIDSLPVQPLFFEQASSTRGGE